MTHLLNQFDGGSSPVDPKYMGNLPRSTVDEKLINDNERCPTCMEVFVKVGFLKEAAIITLYNRFKFSG